MTIRLQLHGISVEVDTVQEATSLLAAYQVDLGTTPRHVEQGSKPSRRKAPKSAPTRRQPSGVVTAKDERVLTILRKARDGIGASDLARQASLSRTQLKTVLNRLRESGRARSAGRALGARWHATTSKASDADDLDPAPSRDELFEIVWNGSQKDVSLLGDGYQGSTLSGVHSLSGG